MSSYFHSNMYCSAASFFRIPIPFLIWNVIYYYKDSLRSSQCNVSLGFGILGISIIAIRNKQKYISEILKFPKRLIESWNKKIVFLVFSIRMFCRHLFNLTSNTIWHFLEVVKTLWFSVYTYYISSTKAYSDMYHSYKTN